MMGDQELAYLVINLMVFCFIGYRMLKGYIEAPPHDKFDQ